MHATRPAAGAALAFIHFFQRPHDAAGARGGLFGVLDPANELVAPSRREALPKADGGGGGANRRAQVVGAGVGGAVEERVGQDPLLSARYERANGWGFSLTMAIVLAMFCWGNLPSLFELVEKTVAHPVKRGKLTHAN